jgi:hypothetical protein
LAERRALRRRRPRLVAAARLAGGAVKRQDEAPRVFALLPRYPKTSGRRFGPRVILLGEIGHRKPCKMAVGGELVQTMALSALAIASK